MAPYKVDVDPLEVWELKEEYRCQERRLNMFLS